MRGRTVRISLPRRMVIDFLHFAAAVPTIPVQRRMALHELAGARAACRDRVRWTVLFTKAYALVAREFPELRRAYVTIPSPMFYEYPVSYANVVVERTYEGERALFSIVIKDPAERPLQELGVVLQDASAANIDDVKEFRRSLRIARLPLPLRRLIWWVGLNVGRQRARHFGTFTLSVYSALNAESLHPLTPLTTLLTYGVIDRDGHVNVRIIYDHRVLDGATVARALARLEEILNTEIVSELRSLSQER